MKWVPVWLLLLTIGCDGDATPSLDARVVAASDDASAVDASIAVRGSGACAHLSIESFLAEPSTIAPGASTTLSWNGVMARGCTLQPGDVHVGGGAASHTVSPTSTTDYTLQCIGTACLDGVGAPIAYVTVTVR